MVAPPDAVVVYRSPSRARCRERALVLHAMGIEHELAQLVQEHGRTWVVWVPGHRAVEAVDQLDLYARENRNWPRRVLALPYHQVGSSGVAAYAVVLLLVAGAKANSALGWDWFGAGRLQAGLVKNGEWWRTVTALTLHLDATHLLGNLLFGAAFGLIAGHLLGNGLAWCTILLAGTVGNALDAMLHASQHTAVGASTAVFAALGLIAAYVWRRRRDLKGRWAIRWSPVVGAVVLLAYTGSGGERTDVVAHLTGFLAGILSGWWYGRLGSRLDMSPRSQRWLAAGAILVIVLAWAIALGAHG